MQPITRRASATAADLAARQRQSVRRTLDDDELEGYGQTRMPTSARRYQVHDQVVPRSTFAQKPAVQQRTRPRVPAPSHPVYAMPERYEEEEEEPRRKRRRRPHGLLVFGVGMIAMLCLWAGLQWAITWWQVSQDDGRYGRPRTTQYDVVIGHNDSPDHPTHILAINLNAKVTIIELPGGDRSKTRIYTGPQLYGDGASLFPVTLTFRDMNGDGRIDMLVHVQGSQIVYLNQQVGNVWQFVPQQMQ